MYNSVSYVQEMQRLLSNEQAHEADELGALARISRHCIYLFDLDHSPATCFMHPLWPEQQFRVNRSSAGKLLYQELVKDSAWSIVLGKNQLPKAVLSPKYYQRNNMIVLSKHADQYYAQTLMENRAPAPSETFHQELGLFFVDVEFEIGVGRVRKGQ